MAPLRSDVPQGYYRGQTLPYHPSEVPDPETPEPSYNISTSRWRLLPSSSSSSQSSGHGSQHQSPGNTPLALHPSVFDSPHPDAGDYLRQQLNLPAGAPVNLLSLPDPPPGQKPSQALPVLIKLAIYGSSRGKLTLQEIYTALEERFEWFKEHRTENAWKVCCLALEFDSAS